MTRKSARSFLLATFLRSLIVFTYLSGVAPWFIFVLTGWWMFAFLGVVFGIVLLLCWPVARNDWKIAASLAKKALE